jgi:alpha-beta hydrolase superfamily lysophospholipase
MMRATSLLIPLLIASTTLADDVLPKLPTKFEFNGHRAYFYEAPKPAPGTPWVWYFPTLNAGIGIVGYDLGEVRGAPDSTKQFTEFYEEMVRRGWSPKPILLGQSRGGLMALAWAIKNPDKAQAIVGIYPVCNLKTWGLKNLPVMLADYKLPEAELRARIAEFNPIDNLQSLIDKKVPIFIVQGKVDKAVPHEEHALVLKQRYESGQAPITVQLFDGLGHESALEFFENKELLQFVLQQAGVKAQTP